MEITEQIETLPDRVGIVRNPNYGQGIRQSEVSYFSPKEFIEFDSLPPFIKNNLLLKSQITDNLNEIVNEFSDYDQIIDFYIDSSISLTNKTDVTEEQVMAVFIEGLNRSLTIGKRISGLIDNLLNERLGQISDNVNSLIERVEKLDDNDNILNLNAKLIKSKALQKSVEKRKRISVAVKTLFTGISMYTRSKFEVLQTSYTEVRKRLKLDKAASQVSSDISNYLSDIQKRIYKLPVIYQHLFENTPIKEFNLFQSRGEEINRLNIAYNDWLIGNYAATMIVGENGSGKSSLLLYFANDIKLNYKVIHFYVDRYYYNESDYYNLVKEIFNRNNLDSDKAIEEYINSYSSRRIVIIDGLERVFIRKIKGFYCIQKLLSLIVSTNKKIFWVCSVSLHAANFLNKTISLKDHFDYSIELNSLTTEQIKSIILKRNRLSGYKLNYIDEKNNPKQLMAEHEKQKLLEDGFFNELNKFANSNISLSLKYWLESIHTIKADDLYVKSFSVPDFSFLESLNPEKIYTLLLVVIHGKISVNLHAFICNQSTEKSQSTLTILKEDSILIEKGDYFILNGFLYRHVIEMLSIKNLIH